jgi:ABC-type sulfate/molybdate transport systems ATPase subunit
LTRSQTIALTIARALAGSPSILVLDRTLDWLGAKERRATLDALLSRSSVSVLLITDESGLVSRANVQLDLSELFKPHGEAA